MRASKGSTKSLLFCGNTFPDAASLVLASSVDSLDAISAGLTAICERLANSSAMVTDHPEDLLRLDAIAQRLRRALEARRDSDLGAQPIRDFKLFITSCNRAPRSGREACSSMS